MYSFCFWQKGDRYHPGREDKASILNNIYIGKVQKVVTGINAAFVDLGVTIGYYSLDEIKNIYLPSREETVN